MIHFKDYFLIKRKDSIFGFCLSKAQRHKGTKAQRHKGTKAQRHKGTKAQSKLDFRFQVMGMGEIRTYRDLAVWQKAIELVTCVYENTKSFPADEKYSLVSQIRRAAVSIPSNIAEGYGRKHTNDYLRYLQISIGSVFEIQTQLIISKNLNYIDNEQYDNLENKTREIERMLSSLISKIKH